MPKKLRLASYNVHRCVGLDRKRDPDRVAAVIRELRADLVALQEVDAGYHASDDSDQLERLAEATGMNAVPGPVLQRGSRWYGNAVLTRYPVRRCRALDLTVRGREPRGALDMEIDAGGTPVRIVAAHLGLGVQERETQVRWLLRALGRHDGHPLVILGDFNEWLPYRAWLRRVEHRFGPAPALRSYPARLPLLPLDRIWVRPLSAATGFRVHASPKARIASDHLPVCAALALPGVR